jgi:hypothetical protein
VIIHNNGSIAVFDFDRDYHVLIELRFPEQYGHLLDSLEIVQLFEGSRLVGVGTVLEK